MKRALAVTAVAALCVTGSAFGSGFIGSGYRAGTTEERSGGYIGSDGRTGTSDDSGTWGSGTRDGYTGSGAGREEGGGDATSQTSLGGSGHAFGEYRIFDGVRFVRVLVFGSADASLIVTLPE